MQIARDQYGIPKVNAERIEELAEHFLEVLFPSVLTTLTFTPLAYLFRTLEEENYCSVIYNEDLGTQANGMPCLGAYSFTRTAIIISRSLPKQDPRYPFTCAHEMGHFYLHRSLRHEVLRDVGPIEIRDSPRELATDSPSGGPRSLIEWQANKFAACILMPRSTVQLALAKIQKELNIGRIGKVWLDHQQHNQRAYEAIVTRLARHYRVSRSVAKYRLQELGLVEIGSTYGLLPINQALGNALRELFFTGA